MNIINNFIINNNIYDKKKTIIINYFFINSFILIKINFNYIEFKYLINFLINYWLSVDKKINRIRLK